MIIAKFRFFKFIIIAGIVLIVSILLFMFNSFFKEPRVHVLFIGNSLTSVNDLPGTVAWLAKSRHIHIEYDMYAPGGYTFAQHAVDPLLREKINKGNWDFVVLQEQSQRPAFKGQQLETIVAAYASQLSRMIREVNPGVQIVFYMTMAKKNGDPMNAASVPEVKTYPGMQERINAGYFHLAEQNRAILVPVGIIWKNVRASRPDIKLYMDETHPNMAGTYLAACAFYALLFKDSPVGLPHPKEVGADAVVYIQKIIEESIQSRSWDFGQGVTKK